METSNPTLLIPVENQVRELDPKLLLACAAAKRGFPSIVGPRREMHFYIPSFPKSIYLSKSMTKASAKVFLNLRVLGHAVVVWDEEALVHLPPETYYKHRISPVSLSRVTHLLAWGEDNVALWRQYPDFPIDAPPPITITGNPRGDLLRKEIRLFYNRDVANIRETFGDFILVNTNFGLVNAFFPDMNLIPPSDEKNGEIRLGPKVGSLGLNRESAVELRDHKNSILEDFKKLIPQLEKHFPDYNIVIRPHPAENQDIYHQIAECGERIRVTNEGNVVPWLMAAKALIHNGCTTGVEAYAIGTPAISYRTSVNERFDLAFHHLANELSHQCFDDRQLLETLNKILTDDMQTAGDDKRQALIGHYLAAQKGPLASDRMVDVLELVGNEMAGSRKPAFSERMQSRMWATKRRIKKRFRGYRQNLSHNRPEFLRHRYPDLSIEEVRSRTSRFMQLLGDDSELKIEQLYNRFFKIKV